MAIKPKKEFPSAMFRVKNVSKGTRMIQTPNNKFTSLMRGESREMKLAAHVARSHAQAAANRPGKYMEIEALDSEARSMLAGVSTAPEHDTGGAPLPPREDPVPPDDAAKDDAEAAAKAELAGRADSMDINELRSEARILLRGAWPRNAGNISREKIKELLTAPMATAD